jgi:membrane protein DedA with SNARE-associated domain
MVTLLVAGALVASGRLPGWGVVATAATAAVLGDLVWYALGRWRGGAVLAFLCRISLEPDTCVRRTQDLFGRYGLRAFLFARFVPGMGTVLPPLAALFGVGPARFVALDGAGALVWSSTYITLGALFAEQLELVAAGAERLGGALAALGLAAAAYAAVKYARRRLAAARLAVPRVTPEVLAARLAAGEPLTVVDLRHPLDRATSALPIEGALAIPLEQLGGRLDELPPGRDIVLVCG